MTGHPVAFCGCAHAEALHDGPCQVSLPAFIEEELPAWRCPCPGFTQRRERPRGPWRWHAGTSSWAAVVAREEDTEVFGAEQFAVFGTTPPLPRSGAEVAGEASTGVNLPDLRAC